MRFIIAWTFATVIWLFVGFGFPSTLFANEYAKSRCQEGSSENWQCIKVLEGQSWESLFPEPEYLIKVQKFNRQNVSLRAGQQLLLPLRTTEWNELSPFPNQVSYGYNDLFIFSPQKLAWAHYIDGRMISWGPAVGGKTWCSDIGRTCRTKTGTFSFTEAANAGRRSGLFPVGCADRDSDGNITSRKRCARMPYFVRFTNQGQGIHARSMRGKNASHGCVGVFLSDVVYINNHVRSNISKTNYGYFTPVETVLSQIKTTFLVLPYDNSKFVLLGD